jgi:hypothetical protein
MKKNTPKHRLKQKMALILETDQDEKECQKRSKREKLT